MGWLRDGLSVEWALATLAAAWPERAAVWIDQTLAGSAPHGRVAAIEAAALLPEALARPRLLEGAALPEHAAAERAKDLWFRRFGEASPIDPLAGVPVELLEGPPSEALLARLGVLRGTSAEAAGRCWPPRSRRPSREALVLLLYSLRSVGPAHERAGLEGFSDVHFVVQLASGLSVWVGALLRRFGAPAFDGILAMAAREARAGSEGGLLDALLSPARKGAFDEAQRERLRDLAARLLDGTSAGSR